MPNKNPKTPLTEKQRKTKAELKKAKKTGANAARVGAKCPTVEALQLRNKYTPKQAEAYLKAFDTAVGGTNETQMALKTAKNLGKNAARRGLNRPTRSNLKKLHKYTVEQAKVCLEAYDKTAAGSNKKQIALNKAKSAGADAARKGCERSTIALLKRRNNYTSKQAQIYLDAFDETSGTAQTQLLRKAKYAGKQAVHQSPNRPTIEILIQRNGYTTKQAEIYLENFDKSLKNLKKITGSSKKSKAKESQQKQNTKQNKQAKQITSKTPQQFLEKQQVSFPAEQTESCVFDFDIEDLTLYNFNELDYFSSELLNTVPKIQNGEKDIASTKKRSIEQAQILSLQEQNAPNKRVHKTTLETSQPILEDQEISLVDEQTTIEPIAFDTEFLAHDYVESINTIAMAPTRSFLPGFALLAQRNQNKASVDSNPSSLCTPLSQAKFP